VKKEWARKWVEALRSGKYKQGQHHLKWNNTFCCLGVLCDISKVGSWGDGPKHAYYCDKSATLPDDVLAETGVKHSSGVIGTWGTTLVELNDGVDEVVGRSFEEIADIIEMFWEEL
jgi:hypothetical protein